MRLKDDQTLTTNSRCFGGKARWLVPIDTIARKTHAERRRCEEGGGGGSGDAPEFINDSARSNRADLRRTHAAVALAVADLRVDSLECLGLGSVAAQCMGKWRYHHAVNSEGTEQVDYHPRARVLSQRDVQDCSMRTCRTESAGLQAVSDSSLASFSCRIHSANNAGRNAATTRGSHRRGGAAGSCILVLGRKRVGGSSGIHAQRVRDWGVGLQGFELQAVTGG
jgi:hypothetical protein